MKFTKLRSNMRDFLRLSTSLVAAFCTQGQFNYLRLGHGIQKAITLVQATSDKSMNYSHNELLILNSSKIV